VHYSRTRGDDHHDTLTCCGPCARRDLVELDNEMKESVKSLDLEMQNLVYTNYNKVNRGAGLTH